MGGGRAGPRAPRVGWGAWELRSGPGAMGAARGARLGPALLCGTGLLRVAERP